MTPLVALKAFFGYDSFRPGQQEIVEAVVSGKDVLALLPTGGGKSLCFQIPGLVLGGTTIVISPLISLMVDQVARLESLGLAATHLTSALPPAEQDRRLELLAQGHWQFVYVSPEKLSSDKFLAALTDLRIPLVAVDEAHCISEWGHDFRPEYRQISTFTENLPTRPTVIAVTATATQKVVSEIISNLNLRTPRIFTRSFRRDNISIKVISCTTYNLKVFQLLYWLKRNQDQAGIIYSLTRSSAETVVKLIQQYLPDTPVGLYHGGLSAETRAQVQADFLANRLPLISATSAFGMGIDKSNIRFVIHFQLPLTLEEYYQEIGRAGRDGQASAALLLYQAADAQPAWKLVGQNRPKQVGFQKLLGYCAKHRCRRQQLLAHFGEFHTSACQQCDACRPEVIQALATEKHDFSRFFTNVSRCFHGERQRRAQISNEALQWLFLLKPQTPGHIEKIPGLGTGWSKEVWPLIKTPILNLR